ncbi:hypothetical protein EDC04DRAFT_2583513, partial [Pisolithus marmoratus]
VGIPVMATTGGKALKDDIMQLSEVVHVLASTPFHILDFAGKNIADPGEFPVFIVMRVYSIRELTHFPSFLLVDCFILFSATSHLIAKHSEDKRMKSPHEINLMKHLTLHNVTQYCAYVKV